MSQGFSRKSPILGYSNKILAWPIYLYYLKLKYFLSKMNQIWFFSETYMFEPISSLIAGIEAIACSEQVLFLCKKNA